MTLAEYIRKVRFNLHLNQSEFAELIGRDRSIVSRYENAETIPPGNILLKIQELEKAQELEKTDHTKQ